MSKRIMWFYDDHPRWHYFMRVKFSAESWSHGRIMLHMRQLSLTHHFKQWKVYLFPYCEGMSGYWMSTFLLYFRLRSIKSQISHPGCSFVHSTDWRLNHYLDRNPSADFCGTPGGYFDIRHCYSEGNLMTFRWYLMHTALINL